MPKILYNLNGRQYLEECIGVTSDAQILWNDRHNGLLPAITLGQMEAFDSLVNVLDSSGNPVHLPQLDSNGNPVMQEELNSNGVVVLDAHGNPVMIPVLTSVIKQEMKHQLRLLDAMIPSHVAALASEAQAVTNASARAYLASTDWMILRQIDSGIACPDDVKAARAVARASIV
jgi:hypothetical protein